MTIAHMATFDHGTVEEFLTFWILLAHFRMLVGVLLEKEYDSGTKWQYSAFMYLHVPSLVFYFFVLVNIPPRCLTDFLYNSESLEN